MEGSPFPPSASEKFTPESWFPRSHAGDSANSHGSPLGYGASALVSRAAVSPVRALSGAPVAVDERQPPVPSEGARRDLDAGRGLPALVLLPVPPSPPSTHPRLAVAPRD